MRYIITGVIVLVVSMVACVGEESPRPVVVEPSFAEQAYHLDLRAEVAWREGVRLATSSEEIRYLNQLWEQTVETANFAREQRVWEETLQALMDTLPSLEDLQRASEILEETNESMRRYNRELFGVEFPSAPLTYDDLLPEGAPHETTPTAITTESAPSVTISQMGLEYYEEDVLQIEEYVLARHHGRNPFQEQIDATRARIMEGSGLGTP